MILYILVAVWLDATTGFPQDMQRLLPAESAEECLEQQLAQPAEHPRNGTIKIYGCVPQSMFGEDQT